MLCRFIISFANTQVYKLTRLAQYRSRAHGIMLHKSPRLEAKEDCLGRYTLCLYIHLCLVCVCCVECLFVCGRDTLY